MLSCAAASKRLAWSRQMLSRRPLAIEPPLSVDGQRNLGGFAREGVAEEVTPSPPSLRRVTCLRRVAMAASVAACSDGREHLAW